jgi:LmbE family N-acetylglucosaminyl deacetylase
MPITIREIVASEHIDAAWGLLEMHREELATHKDEMVLKPRRDRYEALEAAGVMLSLGLFKDDELIGYSINIIDRNLHYADLTVCQNDLLYVHPDHRARHGVRLILATESYALNLADVNPMLMLWHAKQGTPFANLLPRLGYGVQDIILSKVL